MSEVEPRQLAIPLNVELEEKNEVVHAGTDGGRRPRQVPTSRLSSFNVRAPKSGRPKKIRAVDDRKK